MAAYLMVNIGEIGKITSIRRLVIPKWSGISISKVRWR